MKIHPFYNLIIAAVCTLASAHGFAQGRIYIGSLQDAPAWVKDFVPPAPTPEKAAMTEAWFKHFGPGPRHALASTLRAGRGGPQVPRERGLVLSFDPSNQTGLISGDDGVRWVYRAADFIQGGPLEGERVDFEPDQASGFALDLFPLRYVNPPQEIRELYPRNSGAGGGT